MSEDSGIGGSKGKDKAKPRKRETAKRDPQARVKAGFVLSVETVRKIAVHSAYEGITQSELIEQLVTEHCKTYVVHVRGKNETAEPGQGRGAEPLPPRQGVTAAMRAAHEKAASAREA